MGSVLVRCRCGMMRCRYSVVRRRGSQEVATRVTVSAGVTASGVNDTLDSLLSRADTALYMAKNQGRNQVALLM